MKITKHKPILKIKSNQIKSNSYTLVSGYAISLSLMEVWVSWSQWIQGRQAEASVKYQTLGGATDMILKKSSNMKMD